MNKVTSNIQDGIIVDGDEPNFGIISELWDDFEIRQALEVGDLDRVATLLDMKQSTDWQ